MAFWSAQDIADQKASRLFSVLGKVDSASPEILLTAGSNQQEKKLEIADVFDMDCHKLYEHSDYSISDELINNIKERKYTAPAYVKPIYNKPTTTPKSYAGHGNYYAGGSTYNTTKSTLLGKIHTYATSYTFSPLKIQELCIAFFDFLEEEAVSKDLVYCTDSNLTEEVFEKIEGIASDSLYTIMADLKLIPADATDIDDIHQSDNPTNYT